MAEITPPTIYQYVKLGHEFVATNSADFYIRESSYCCMPIPNGSWKIDSRSSRSPLLRHHKNSSRKVHAVEAVARCLVGDQPQLGAELRLNARMEHENVFDVGFEAYQREMRENPLAHFAKAHDCGIDQHCINPFHTGLVPLNVRTSGDTIQRGLEKLTMRHKRMLSLSDPVTIGKKFRISENHAAILKAESMPHIKM